MIIGVPKETVKGEKRAALVPASVKRLAGLGLEVLAEKGLGAACSIPDREYEGKPFFRTGIGPNAPGRGPYQFCRSLFR